MKKLALLHVFSQCVPLDGVFEFRSTAINAFLKNYEVTLATFYQLSSDNSVRSESRSKIDGVLKSLARIGLWRLIWIFLYLLILVWTL